MDARQLRYFLAVVDEGSFTKAAEAIPVAQPSLSQTIKGLERELGVPLFHRVGRSVSLSEAGRELEGPARDVLRGLDVATAKVRGLRGLDSGKVQIAAMPTPSIEPLTTLLADFHLLHPHIAFDVAGTFTLDETLDEVRHGRAEFGFVGGRHELRSADLAVVPLTEQPLMLALSPQDDRWTGVSFVRLPDLADAPLVISHRGTLMREFADELVADGSGLRIAAEVAHRTSILSFVLAGIGHAILPSAWTSLARSAGVRMLPIEGAPSLRVDVVSRKQGLTPAAREFLALAQRFAEEKPSDE